MVGYNIAILDNDYNEQVETLEDTLTVDEIFSNFFLTLYFTIPNDLDLHLLFNVHLLTLLQPLTGNPFY